MLRPTTLACRWYEVGDEPVLYERAVLVEVAVVGRRPFFEVSAVFHPSNDVPRAVGVRARFDATSEPLAVSTTRAAVHLDDTDAEEPLGPAFSQITVNGRRRPHGWTWRFTGYLPPEPDTPVTLRHDSAILIGSARRTWQVWPRRLKRPGSPAGIADGPHTD